jgi:hypothetical protein
MKKKSKEEKDRRYLIRCSPSIFSMFEGVCALENQGKASKIKALYLLFVDANYRVFLFTII